MDYKNILLFITILCAYFIILFPTIKTYNAKTYDYGPASLSTPEETLFENVNRYLQQLESSINEDIIVFPEYGLNTVHVLENEKSVILEVAVEIPESIMNVKICDGTEQVHKVLQDLSCGSKTSRSYVVVNLVEKSGKLLYNTNIVFDREGKIIAKYRKINLFSFEKIALTAGTETVTFKTDFDVTFGIFTCYDILFNTPSKRVIELGATDIIFPTAWIAKLPFYGALTVQDGYAKKHAVNLIASNYVNPTEGMGGSGIYHAVGGNDKLIISGSTSVQSARGTVTKITKPESNRFCQRSGTIGRALGVAPEISNYKMENWINSKSTKFNIQMLDLSAQQKYNKEICSLDKKICCQVDFSVEKPYKSSTYALMAFSEEGEIKESVCGIVVCLNNNNEQCGEIDNSLLDFIIQNVSITVKNIDKYKIVRPVSLKSDLKPAVYSYCEENNQATIKIQNTAGITTLGIFVANSANSLLGINIILLVIVSIKLFVF